MPQETTFQRRFSRFEGYQQETNEGVSIIVRRFVGGAVYHNNLGVLGGEKHAPICEATSPKRKRRGTQTLFSA
ncbi:MAG: hypothetical protein JXN61_12920 [Sedimentisphaerales bacterium]|nr:hypothetical protein [Sedimentisphaerales bacterium]